ncbi:MAG TPA: isopeptide-forming domain-containing fimbrial protein [Baekduia sp.]|uniref:isopeptide-forming domain-containing fimbrial protein n=1 Tax=Baekduia sp. TaxID=2600305 RepID=UPI002D768677|nr:isopeptide-forming domain-containing fimbrial protein [Baekduia sp.]HET6505589.1 isopeptide-forming domain-containing fimbrial protein [Baekduia sp.]
MPSRLRLVLCALLALALLVPAAAQADGTPDISVAVSSRSVLYGEDVPVTVTATNPPGTYGYNLSFRVVLPAGVSYAGGASVAPQVVADKPLVGQTTLIFSNVSDLSPNSSRALDFTIAYDHATYDVGDTFGVLGQAFVNDDPRFVPKFDPATGAAGGGATGTAGTAGTGGTVIGAQKINAIKVTKDEPSAEGEILRGVHDHQTVYTVTVENNDVHSTTGTTLDDYLPAGLEFLGCGNGTDDHTTDAPTNPGSTEEYPGAGPIDIPSLTGCVDPISVDTETVDPDGPGPLPSAVYTHVVWDVGTLAPGETRTFPYRAAVPLRANTTTFTGTRPTAASGGQGANLDNNNGPEVADETALTNLVHATGDYQGGTPVPVSDDATLTRTAEDYVVRKTASAGALEEGAITTWTLRFATSEYRYVDDATVTDTLPNGFCPLDATNRTSGNDGADSECDPVAGNEPSAPYETAVENADGTWTLTWDASVLAHLGHIGIDDSFTITFPTRTRARYQSNFLPAGPILTRDAVKNTVTTDAEQYARCTAPGTADCATPGPKVAATIADGSAIADASEAGQTATDPVIDKKVAASGADCSAVTFVDTVPHYHPGDRVCWWVRVTFPSAVDTTPQALADFLPAGADYEGGSETAGPGDTVTSTLDASGAASDKVLRWTVSGSTVPSGSKVFSRVFSTIARPTGSPATGDITGNLLKFSSTDTPGVSTSLRDEADYVLDTPSVELTKGVRTVVRGGTTVTGPLAPNSDNIAVQGGDQVTYRVDVTNSGAQDAIDVQVRDLLPADYQCPLTPGPISDGGTCVDGGLANDQVRWTLPTLAAGATTTLTYTLTVPSDIGPHRSLVNHAGVRQFEGATNLGGTYVYTPASNIDPTNPATPNAPAADDVSEVHTADDVVTKSRQTEITEAGNSATQATIGEEITYTLSATVRAGTTLHGTAQLTDTVDSSTRQPYVAGSATATLDGAALPAGFTLDTGGSTPRVVFPTDYAVPAGATDATIELVFKTKVADVAGNTRTSGNLTNQAHLTWTDPTDGAQTRDSASVATQIVEPLIAQDKRDDVNPGRAAPGDIITYTVTTTNPSTPGRVSTAHDLVTEDVVPVGLTPIGAAPGNAALADGATVPGSGGATWDAGTRTISKAVSTLAPDASASFSYRVQVDDPGVGGATKVNTVTTTATSLGSPADADGERTTGTGYSASKSDTITLVGATIAKSASPTTATIGTPVTYTLRVTIPASLALYDVTAVDVLPDSLDFDGYGTATCVSGCPLVNPVNTYTSVVSGTTKLAWDLGDFATPLATPQVVELTYQAHVRATHRTGGAAVVVGQTAVNSATVASDRTDLKGAFDAATIPATFDDTSTPATATVTVVEPKLTVDKQVKVGGGSFVDGPATARSDSGLTYRIVVTNTGNAPAYDVTVGDTPDAALTGVTPGTPPTGVTVTDGWTAADPAMAWRIAGPIAAGDSVTLTYTADLVAASGLHDGQNVDNTATVPHYFGAPEATRTANPTTIYRDYTDGGSDATRVVLDFPTFTLVKNVGASGGAKTGTAEVGQDFTWRLTVTNTSGTASASAVHVTDTLPPNWAYKAGSATIAPGGAALEPTVTAHATGDALDWNVGTLAAGASKTVTLVARPLPAAATTPGTGTAANVNSAAVTAATDEAGNRGNADGDYGSAPDTATATLHLPDLAIVKTPDHGAVNAGETSSFDVAVTNNGNATARGVDIADVLPEGLTYTAGDATASPSTGFSEASVAAGPGTGQTTVHWTVATLAAGATVTVTVPVTVGHDVADGTTLTNAAEARSDEVPTPVGDTGSLDVSASADLSIAKTGAARYVAGTSYTWHLRVRNLGPSDAQAATVADALPFGTTFVSADAPCAEAGGVVTCALGTIEPGFDHTYDIEVAVDPGRTGPSLSNTATVSASTTDPVPYDNVSTWDAGGSTLADVSVTKAAAPAAILKNGQTTFTMVVHNAGPSVARSVTLTDPMPAGLTVVSASGTGCAVAADTVTCALGDLGVGADATVTVVAKGIDNGTWTNTATVATITSQPAGGGDPDSADASVVVGPVADLQVAKTAPGTVAAGGTLTWKVSVANAGPDPATGVTLTDPLPAGTVFVAADPGCAEAAGTVTCDVGALAVGDRAERTITATVPVALADQTLINTVTATADQGDDHPEDDTASASTLVGPAADLGVVKTGPASAAAGGQIAWTIVATDHGPSAATGVTVTDALPDGVTPVSATPTQGACAIAGATVTCALGSLASGGAAQIQLVGTIAADRVGATLTNGAEIRGDQPDPVAGNDRSSATTTVGPAAVTGPDLKLVKSVIGDAKPQLGRALRYALDVTNAGDAAATGVVVTDTLPANLEYVTSAIPGGTCKATNSVVTCAVASLAAGETRRATVTTRPIAPGPVRNTASVLSATAETRAVDNVASAGTTVTAPRATLRLVKTTTRRSPVRAGQHVTYQVRVTNVSTRAAADVVVCDTLPKALVVVSAPGAKFRHGRPCWTIAMLRAGHGTTFRLTARLTGGARPGRIRNVASVTARNASSRRAAATITAAAQRVAAARGGGVTG